MARKTNIALVFFTMFMVMLLIPTAMADYAPPETKFTFYTHDYSSGGPNSTNRLLVGFAGTAWSFTQFGTVYVFDDLVTTGPELTSPTVGRLQGIGVIASLNGLNAYTGFSLVFTNQAYNGSTIQIQGGGNRFQGSTEFSVVSGTDKFRFSNGYFTFETISYDPSISYTLFRINLTILTH